AAPVLLNAQTTGLPRRTMVLVSSSFRQEWLAWRKKRSIPRTTLHCRRTEKKRHLVRGHSDFSNSLLQLPLWRRAPSASLRAKTRPGSERRLKQSAGEPRHKRAERFGPIAAALQL